MLDPPHIPPSVFQDFVGTRNLDEITPPNSPMTPNNTPNKHRPSQTLRRTSPLIPANILKRSSDFAELPPSPPLKKARTPRTDDQIRGSIERLITDGPNHKMHDFRPEANEIIPRLYISDVVTATTPDTLDELRITHIISVMMEADIPKVSMSSLKIQPKRYVLPILDRPNANLSASLTSVVDFIAEAMDDPDARVLCHCYAGASRSTSVIVAYLVSSGYVADVDEALALVKRKRKISQPNPGFIAQLRAWHDDQIAAAETEKE